MMAMAHVSDSTDSAALDPATCVAVVEAADQSAISSLREVSSGSESALRAYAAWALARLDEGAERSVRTWQVDPRGGDDAATGDQRHPFRTLAEAVRRARAGDTVLLADGVHRSTLAPIHGGREDAPLTFAAAAGARPVITAADPWQASWRAEGEGLWSTTWLPHPWDDPKAWESPGPDTPANRCEQLWCDGALLVHTADRQRLAREAGTCLTTDGRLWVNVGGAPSRRSWERSVRRQCLAPLVRGLGHIVVRGLVLRGGAAPPWTGANWLTWDQEAVLAVRGGHHWLIEDCDIGWGNAQGVELGAGGFSRRLAGLPRVEAPEGGHVLRRCQIHDHGIAGVVGCGGVNDVLIEDCHVSGNVRKDHQGTCEEAGIKLHGCQRTVIRGNHVERNRGFGIWLDYHCANNRITGNLVADNDAHGIFHEISPGPLLVDSNVVVESRRGRSADGAHGGCCGFYTHDGSRATVLNNAFVGVPTGMRVRALLHRRDGDQPTRTEDNQLGNNLLIDSGRDAIQLMPEQPRCSGNGSDANLLWAGGGEPRCRLDGASEGLWSLGEWTEKSGHDRTSLVLPPDWLGIAREPTALRDQLRRAWFARGLPETGIPAGVRPLELAAWLALICPGREGWRAGEQVQLGPDRGLQLWSAPHGARLMSWQGAGQLSEEPLPSGLAALRLPDPSTAILAVGEEAKLPVSEHAQVIVAGLPAVVAHGVLALAAPIDLPAGCYRIVLADSRGWWTQAVQVRPVAEIVATHATADGSVVVEIDNHRAVAVEAVVAIGFGGRTWKRPVQLPPGCTPVAVPVEADVGRFHISVRLPGAELVAEPLLSFARAPQAATPWADCPAYGLDRFPGGGYPDGAWASVLYKGRLSARWRARWDAAGVHVRVEVRNVLHYCIRGDVDGAHCGSGIKLAARVQPGSLCVVAANLRSDTGAMQAGFCKTRDEAAFPIGMSNVIERTVVRDGIETTYDVLLTWPMLGCAAAPPPGTELPFSVMVSQNDEGELYGLQWFFGIEYGHHEGDESWMGRLRLA